MPTDSSIAGFLAPSSEPLEDEGLENLLHDVIVGITGIPGDMVRPRWQPEPPQQPDFPSSWVAFGVQRTSHDVFSYQTMVDDGQQVQRDSVLYVLHSFYGPVSSGLCSRFRDGLDVSQNRDLLQAQGLELVEMQEALNIPALLKSVWVKRVDAMVVYRRRTVRTFPVLTITAGQLGLNNERYVTPIIVTP